MLLLQEPTITQFLDLEKAGIISILALSVYLLNKFFQNQISELKLSYQKQIDDLKTEIKDIKDEYRACQKDSLELREEFNNLQLKMLDVISNNTQAMNKFNTHYEKLFEK